MKKKIIILLMMMSVLAQTSASAMPNLYGTLDRIWSDDHTMYYVEIDGDAIPDITGAGYETVSKATKIYKEGQALTKANTTVIQNTATGKRYRIVFTNNKNTLEISNASIDNKGMLSVEGKVLNDEILKMFILKPSETDKNTSYTWSEVDESDMTKTVLDVVEFRASGEGKQVSHQFPNTASSGAYGVLIVGDNLAKNYYNPNIYYTSKQDLDNALEGLNEIVKQSADNSKAKQLADYIKANSKMLYCDTTRFNALSDTAQIMACKELFKADGYADVEKFQDSLYKSIVTAWSSDGKSPEEILKEYKANSAPALYDEYCKLSSKTIVNDALKQAKNNTEFETIFNKMTVVEMLNEAPAPAEIDAVLSAYINYLGFSKSVEDKYAKNKNISARLMLYKPFSTAGEIEKVITSTPETQTGGGGGNSGGGLFKRKSDGDYIGLPQGTKVRYEGNTGKAPGLYEARAYLDIPVQPNHEVKGPLILNWEITNA